jgi:hypothetical protein
LQLADFVHEVNKILSDGESDLLPFHNAEIDEEHLVPMDITTDSKTIVASNCCARIEVHLEDMTVESFKQVETEFVNEEYELSFDTNYVSMFSEELSESGCAGVSDLDPKSRLLLEAISCAWGYESPIGLECTDKDHSIHASRLPLEKVLRKYWQKCLAANCACSETSFEYLGFAYSDPVIFKVGSMGKVTWNPSAPIEKVLTGQDHIVEFLYNFFEHAVQRRGEYIMATPEGPFLPDTLSNPYVIRWLLEYSYGSLGETIEVKGELPDLADIGL